MALQPKLRPEWIQHLAWQAVQRLARQQKQYPQQVQAAAQAWPTAMQAKPARRQQGPGHLLHWLRSHLNLPMHWPLRLPRQGQKQPLKKPRPPQWQAGPLQLRPRLAGCG